MTKTNPRQLAFLALKSVQKGAFADVALDHLLEKADLTELDRRLMTELVYGCVRRMRSLDAVIDQLAKKKSHQQPPDLRLILHLGLYQLRYLHHIPPAAAVNTTVQLAKENLLGGLTAFVNGILRQYLRLVENHQESVLELPENPLQRLGILHSYPDWIISLWLEQLILAETEQLCEWMNRSPTIDLRINPLRTSIEIVETALQSQGVEVIRVPPLPQALRLTGNVGAIQNLPGFQEGWWTVQDSSAQLVAHLLDPQPGEIIIDTCAAPGGKTTHIAELMGDRGTVWGCDRNHGRLQKLQENSLRLHLQSIQISAGDSRHLSHFTNSAHRVLLDVPCSGLGTLHRHADARWRQTFTSVQQLATLQSELLDQAVNLVKPEGILVYATCTLHPLENEVTIQNFLKTHPNWEIDPPVTNPIAANFITPEGWLKVWPHRHNMDGFFMVRLKQIKSSQ